MLLITNYLHYKFYRCSLIESFILIHCPSFVSNHGGILKRRQTPHLSTGETGWSQRSDIEPRSMARGTGEKNLEGSVVSRAITIDPKVHNETTIWEREPLESPLKVSLYWNHSIPCHSRQRLAWHRFPRLGIRSGFE